MLKIQEKITTVDECPTSGRVSRYQKEGYIYIYIK